MTTGDSDARGDGTFLFLRSSTAPSEYPSIHDVCRLSQKELGGMSPPLFFVVSRPQQME